MSIYDDESELSLGSPYGCHRERKRKLRQTNSDERAPLNSLSSLQSSVGSPERTCPCVRPVSQVSDFNVRVDITNNALSVCRRP